MKSLYLEDKEPHSFLLNIRKQSLNILLKMLLVETNFNNVTRHSLLRCWNRALTQVSSLKVSNQEAFLKFGLTGKHLCWSGVFLKSLQHRCFTENSVNLFCRTSANILLAPANAIRFFVDL